MEIDCYFSTECGAEDGLRKNVDLALALEKIEAQVHFYRIDDNKAAALGLSGSPSVFINGKELQPQGSAGVS